MRRDNEGSRAVDEIVERDGVSDRKLWNKIVISHVSSRSTASETVPVFEGKLQAFERPYFHDERSRAIHTLLRGTSRPLHMRATLVSLFRSLPRDSCIYAFPPTGCSLTRVHAYTRAETASKTRVNRPYSLRAAKKNNI